MMKLVLASSVVAFLAAGSMSVMATEKVSVDDSCKAMATKDHVAADKMGAFMKTCVEKHSKHAAAPAPAAATTTTTTMTTTTTAPAKAAAAPAPVAVPAAAAH